MNEIFNNVAQARNELTELWEQIYLIRDSCNDMLTAIKDRLGSDKTKTDARTAELLKRLNDASCSPSLKRVAELELQQLQSKEFAPTAEEISAFHEEFKCYKQVVIDTRKAEQKLTELLREARSELDKVKAEKNRSEGSPIENWVAGLKKDFDNLQHSGANS